MVLKRTTLIMTGLLPLFIGYIINHLMMTVWLYSFPGGILMAAGLGIVALWFFAGAFSAKFFASNREAVLTLNAAAILVAAVMLLQPLVLGHIGGVIGMTAQFFYLPLMRPAFALMALLPLPVAGMAMTTLISLGYLILASFLGVRWGRSRV